MIMMMMMIAQSVPGSGDKEEESGLTREEIQEQERLRSDPDDDLDDDLDDPNDPGDDDDDTDGDAILQSCLFFFVILSSL